ncbi:hypothetical protein [Rubripirellula obstinata]|nr:hypothetical protein [Rubripirellula obstinata]
MNFKKPQPPSPQQVRENMQRWYVAMESSHEMLMAGLRHKIGPDGDLGEAYRQWNADRRERKIREYEEAYRRRQQRGANNAS